MWQITSGNREQTELAQEARQLNADMCGGTHRFCTAHTYELPATVVDDEVDTHDRLKQIADVEVARGERIVGEALNREWHQVLQTDLLIDHEPACSRR